MLGIIGALDKEIELLVSSMEQCTRQQICSVDFYCGTLCSHEVVIARCGVGKVCAAVCAAVMITHFGADKLINTGVAGGLAPGLKQGDFAVARDFVQHDIDTTALGDEPALVSQLGVVRMPADGTLASILEQLAGAHGNTVCGTIATGDQFIGGDAGTRIRDSFNAVACDMEGGAIAQVCCMAGVPFAALRCISDNADSSAGLDYPQFAAIAAERGASIIIEFVGAQEG